MQKIGKINYRKAFYKFGLSPKSLFWRSQKVQEARFRQLLRDIDLRGKSILDFGCGFGDITPFILERTGEFKYKGVDLVPEFVKTAKDIYGDRGGNPKVSLKFLVRDFIKNPLKEKFDVVLCSGALNSNVADPASYREKAIKVLWDHTKGVLVFNMAGGHPQPKNKKVNRVYYADSLEVLKYCFTLTSKIIFRHHYSKKDFTIIMFKYGTSLSYFVSTVAPAAFNFSTALLASSAFASFRTS